MFALGPLLLLVLVPESSEGSEPAAPCSLPEAWGGAWFLSGRQERIIITARSLGWLGSCRALLPQNKYVLQRPRDDCLQCVAIWPRHDNVLEFKAGECKDPDSELEQLCEISPDVTLNTLVRLDSSPVECPFQGPVSFSYNKGTGLCSSPLSELSQCLTGGQLKLRFHACPDIQQTESRDEVLTCLASWPDDRAAAQTFLVARLQDRYRRTHEDSIRCFLLRKADSGTETGFLVAQSSDATCHGGLSSPTDGFQTFQLGLPPRPDPAHLFPHWALQPGRLLTFDFGHLYSFTADRQAFVVSNYSYTTREATLLSRTTVVQTVDTGLDWVKVVTKSVSDCDQSYQCAVLHRRTPDILELELGLATSVLRAACAHSYFVAGATQMVTLLSEELGIQDCTLSGVHNVTSLSLDTQTDHCDPQGFSLLEARCSSAQQIQFIRDCPTAADRATYFCQGGWEEVAGPAVPTSPSFPFSQGQEGGQVAGLGLTSGFLIAKPKRRDSTSLRRVCLMYTVINETYVWTVGKQGCDRGLTQQSGGHRFTTALTAPCSVAVRQSCGLLGRAALALVIIWQLIKR